jgi:transcriptional regulator with XRE-family HTH domain
MTINERFKFIIRSLGLDQKTFARIVKMEQGSVSDIARGKVKVSKKLSEKMELLFGVSKFYIESGEGQMYIPGTEHLRKPDYYTEKKAINSIAQITSFHEDAWNNEVQRLKLECEEWKKKAEQKQLEAKEKDELISDLRDRVLTLKEQIRELRDFNKDLLAKTKKQ